MNTNELVQVSVKAADDKRAEDIVVLDVKGISLVADYFMICHGNSEKQVEAIARELKAQAQENGIEINRLEGLDKSRWVLIDLGDIIVHVFHRDERSYYNLEKLWGDAPTLNVASMLA
ncbi:ribosome silencing factor [Pseudalkalibacillus berkeleyi]|uniref:Ribosomal silencing factor RsfS n=1 Tax=Pseudalkalibacillus berkeleyi TaxID=1069813 RepID=A0ABS9H2X4_9BACL|nr:ribosome silencing factor [Pseudalkalibacillus berkeleyi]MCF6137995.1 ribosome silencing factor [Pseudalkalibacillus berkeleyi]